MGSKARRYSGVGGSGAVGALKNATKTIPYCRRRASTIWSASGLCHIAWHDLAGTSRGSTKHRSGTERQAVRDLVKEIVATD